MACVLILLFMIVGCSSNKDEPANARPSGVDKYVKKNQIVIQNTSANLKEKLTGSRKAYNLPLLFQFLGDVENKRNAEITFTILDTDGSHATNKLTYKDGTFVYKNSYKGYEFPVGEFHCTDILDNGSSHLSIEGCSESEAIPSMPTVMFTAAQYNAAKTEYRSSKK
jgi:hypothetical protein